MTTITGRSVKVELMDSCFKLMMAMTVTDAGRADPVFASIPDRVLVTHGDTFDLLPGAELLAYTDGYQHAYRSGSALAVQFHPEKSHTAGLQLLANFMNWTGAC